MTTNRHAIVIILRVEDIWSNANDCVRKMWNTPKALTTLAQSLKEHGQDSPITVRPTWGPTWDHVGSSWLRQVKPFPPYPYRIVCGFRRHAAMKMIGMVWIKCEVLHLTDTEALTLYMRTSEGRAKL